MKIYGKFESGTGLGYVVETDQVFDTKYNKKQSEINDELYQGGGGHIDPTILAHKYGVGYTDDITNIHYFFADQESMETFQADNTRTDLILDSIQLESQYSLEITPITPIFNPVFLGDLGNYIQFTFQIENKSHQIIHESVDATYLIQCGDSTTTVNESYYDGETVSFNVDNYIIEGRNEITILLRGKQTKAAQAITFVFQVVDLSLSDTFDIAHVYHNGDQLLIPFTIEGSGVKRMDWYLDGEVYELNTGSYVGVRENDTKSIYIDGLSAGRHNLQYRASVELSNGTKFYSNILSRDFVVDDNTLLDTVILTKFMIPASVGIIDPFTEPIPLNGPVQYEEYEIGYCIYTKNGMASNAMIISLGTNESTYALQNITLYTYTIRSFEDGQKALVFDCNNTTLTFNASIDSTNYDLTKIPGAELEFNGSDRSNSSDNRYSWSYGDYSATLNGFNWIASSGWNDGRLVIPNGASFVTDFRPFADETKYTGYTFEIEFSTSRVYDENQTLIDLTTPVQDPEHPGEYHNRGLLITASEIIFSSRGGTTVSTKYKPEENIRVSIVINQANTGTYARMMFIYIDGILTGAVKYAPTDSFISDRALSITGTANATMSLKQILCYRRTLTAKNILDNFILYRDTVAELVDAYNRNDIYVEGTEIVSRDKLAARTPVIVITGDIADMETWTKDKKSVYKRMDKIEVINLQDPTKNMTLINPSMRCQGTSSMAYPRKNFRFYTQADRKDTTQPEYTTQMFDYAGNELTGENRVYSFKNEAQPVKTWCLKADYAESSSTHNTGVARLWNLVMKNARIAKENIDSRFYLKSLFPNSDTPCRTIAQHKAANNPDFNYDVRTTVDGFPIALFYHLHEEDPLIFLGKYNWNNDKSTESVFGFCDIPGFEPYEHTMECWEVINGDYPCNLFTDVSQWSSSGDGGWAKSFESRYPDDSGKASEATRANGALKTVATWINQTMGAAQLVNGHLEPGNPTKLNKFVSEKWDHLDVYKIAAYYVYLMRFGAVDQTVKNAMFTTEDGIHWYYINYDNDTINGVRNDGALRYGYDIDRQSHDPDSPAAYCYAGHDSVLWNNLEVDTEFMNIVKQVDNALYVAGLTYANTIDMFNVEQSAKWSERTHNEDYEYKYLGFDDQLDKLQGPRKSHRQWWLSNRFAIYDALDGTDAYITNRLEIKPFSSGGVLPGPNDYVTVIPAVDGQIFGYGYEQPTVLGVQGTKDVPIQFNMSQAYYIGTTIKFYNAVYFKEVDLSHISQWINQIDFTRMNSASFDTSISRLTLGDAYSETNTGMTSLTNLDTMKYLEEFNMRNYTGITSIDFSGNKYLQVVDLTGCTNLRNIIMPEAAPITDLYYPRNIQTLQLKDLVSLDTLVIEGGGTGIFEINISNCPQITNSPDFLINWLENKLPEDYECTVTMDNVAWDHIDTEDMMRIAEFYDNGKAHNRENLHLRGYAEMDPIQDPAVLESLIATFGYETFRPGAEFYIHAPADIFLLGPTEVNEGDSAQYRTVVVGGEGVSDTIAYTISDGDVTLHNASIDINTGLLETEETGLASNTITIRSLYLPDGGQPIWKLKDVLIKQRVYPTPAQISIGGDPGMSVTDPNVYTVEYSIPGVTGEMDNTWSLSGDLTNYASITNYTNTSCTIEFFETPSVPVAAGTLTLSVHRHLDEEGVVYATITKPIGYTNSTVAISRITNPIVMDIMVNNNLLHPDLGDTVDMMTRTSAALITSNDINPLGTKASSIFAGNATFRSNCTDFTEFKYFVGVTTLKAETFSGCTALRIIEIPTSVSTIESECFYNCTSLIDITIPASTIGNSCFEYCTGLQTISFTNSCNIGDYAFSRARATTLNFYGGLNGTIGYSLFYNMDYIETINFYSPSNTTVGLGSFRDLLYNISSTKIVGKLIINFKGDGAFIITPNRYDNNNIVAVGTINVDGTVSAITFGSVQASSGYYGACYKMSYLTTLNLNDVNVRFKQNAFSDCERLTTITGDANIIEMGNGCFSNCALSKLPNLSNITDVPNMCFWGNSFTEVTIPNNIITLGSSSFGYCGNLETVNIGSGVNTIPYNCFARSNNISNVHVDSINTTYEDRSSNCIIETAFNTLIFGCKDTIIPNSVTKLGQYCFSNNSNIITMNIPGSVVEIGNSAFYQCSGLTSITIPDSVTTCGTAAFRECSNLSTVNIGSGLSSLSQAMFLGCSSLASITIPSNVTEIGSNCFANCYNLATINGFGNVNTLYSGAFSKTGFVTFTLPSNITSMGSSVFSECTNLTTVTIAVSQTTLPNNTFERCTALNSVTFGSPIEELGLAAFSGCTSLQYITLPNSLLRINNTCFYNTGLVSITIPKNVTNIGTATFGKCDSLTTILVSNENTKYADYGINAVVMINGGTSGTVSLGKEIVVGCKTTNLNSNAFDSIDSRAFNEINFGSGTVTIPSCILRPNAFNQCTFDIVDISSFSPTFTPVNQRYIVFNGCTFNSIEWDSVGIDTYNSSYGAVLESSTTGSITITNAFVGDLANDSVAHYLEVLTELDLGANITNVTFNGNFRFTTSASNANIICRATTPPQIDSVPSRVIHIYVPSGSVQAYKEATGWSGAASKIEAIP